MESNDKPRRKSPEEFLKDIEDSKKGQFKLYIGSAPGVGKTYRMLQEAHEMRESGIDVVIGLIESHGRKDTEALIEDIETIPLKDIPYKGHVLKELDVDSIIARKPEVVFIDELAHTNVPGSTNKKRYEDVLVILNEGINVISAVNIQHLESLHDKIQQITGVKVRERLPDTILQEAKEIILIDVTPEILQERLRTGRIYDSTKIQQALQNFFNRNNLSALRELALREVADDVDERIEKINEAQGGIPFFNASERIMVCVQYDANAEMLIRRGWRFAKRLNAPLYVLHIATKPNENHLKRWRELCNQFNATFIVEEKRDDRNIPRAITDIATKYRVTQIIMGQSARSRWEEITKGSIVNNIMRYTDGIDIHIVAESPNF
ncbi:KdpD-like non-kinase potassium sensor [Halobacillus sp. K22]|uniref:KdpD-like non-kinase potassium sensor n=1 Tax=Halobacillus sp. K22 TaxID=3457431 RepID=UPI003FCC3775